MCCIWLEYICLSWHGHVVFMSNSFSSTHFRRWLRSHQVTSLFQSKLSITEKYIILCEFNRLSKPGKTKVKTNLQLQFDPTGSWLSLESFLSKIYIHFLTGFGFTSCKKILTPLPSGSVWRALWMYSQQTDKTLGLIGDKPPFSNQLSIFSRASGSKAVVCYSHRSTLLQK